MHASDLIDRLRDASADDEDTFTLADSVTEADIEGFHQQFGFAETAKTYADQIQSTLITDLDTDINGHSAREVIASHNNDPDAVDACYVIRADRTIVQPFAPGVGGKEPMDADRAEAERQAHVQRLAEQAAAGDLLDAARAEFGASD